MSAILAHYSTLDPPFGHTCSLKSYQQRLLEYLFNGKLDRFNSPHL